MLALALVLAYVCGSFPSAYIAGRLVKGIDLRTRGSGNLGATNVYREVGAFAAIGVLAADAAKGWVAVALVPRWIDIGGNNWLKVALGAAAILGHAKPIFLLWRGGGKGVATGAGVFLALDPPAVGIAALAFALVVFVTRYVSLGSLAAAAAMPAAFFFLRGPASPLFQASLVISAFVIWAHRVNIRRLLKGEEGKIGRPGAGTR
jgi:glycerol-3-phosphate acyltransferase PlsY